MRRNWLALVGCVLASVLTPAAANGQAPTEDSVTGRSAPGPDTLVFNARSGPSGENPSGVIDLIISGGTIDIPATVKCLLVTGSRATIGADILDSGAIVHYYVEDNDGPGADRLALGGPSVVDCSSAPPPPESPLWRTVTGDLEVVDAQPFPTTKDQCTNGGWRNYGTTFKNQGQCVSFVATSPKRPL